MKVVHTSIFTANSDGLFIGHSLPNLFSMCNKCNGQICVILDTGIPSGVLGKSLSQFKSSEIIQIINKLKVSFNFEFKKASYSKDTSKHLNRVQFGYPYSETHCFRGYPIYGSIKQFFDTDADYILHLDSDMIFYEAPDFSWIQEGVKTMEENDDILCVLPRGGPPTHDNSLNQGTTPYKTDVKRGLYLFKNFTSRHYLIHRERFLSLLPMKPTWLSWREPIKSRLFGAGKMLCWEKMVGDALGNSHFWRADLMTEQAWSLHPGDRSHEFYNLLPAIIQRINCNQFPEEQRGHFDLRLTDWQRYLNYAN